MVVHFEGVAVVTSIAKPPLAAFVAIAHNATLSVIFRSVVLSAGENGIRKQTCLFLGNPISLADAK